VPGPWLIWGLLDPLIKPAKIDNVIPDDQNLAQKVKQFVQGHPTDQ
jgi:hypothetical protein